MSNVQAGYTKYTRRGRTYYRATNARGETQTFDTAREARAWAYGR